MFTNLTCVKNGLMEPVPTRHVERLYACMWAQAHFISFSYQRLSAKFVGIVKI